MMLVCRHQLRRIAAFSVFSTPPARSTSTSSASASSPEYADKLRDSIFTTPESPWDHVFSDIDPNPPPQLPAQRIHMRRNDGNNANTRSSSLSGRKRGQGQNQSLIQRSSGVRHQRASITAREMSVFDDMFDLIFNAMSSQSRKSPNGGPGSGSGSGSSAQTISSAAPSSSSSSFSGQTPIIGRAGAPLNDLFRTMRRQTPRVRWTTAIDEELDRKKETMELFNTDHELLQWVTLELFGESRQWNEEAKGVIDVATSSSPPSSPSSPKERPINHSIYPHLIAHAMRIFRTTYSNPSLSLAIFNYAARVSIPSYVFGCTAPTYNELIEAKWEGWGDLEGVCNALEEMRANGVKIDGRTRIVVERVRREVGEARPGQLEGSEDGQATLDGGQDVNPLARKAWGDLGEVEVMRLLQRIERLALRDRLRKSSPHEEPWKGAVLQPAEDDGWSFDGWDKEKKSGETKKQRAKHAS